MKLAALLVAFMAVVAAGCADEHRDAKARVVLTTATETSQSRTRIILSTHPSARETVDATAYRTYLASLGLSSGAEPALQEGGDDGGTDVLPAVLWTLAGVGVVVVVGGALYLLKRQLGAFPQDPEWVAPIGGIHSRNLPDENTYAAETESPTDHH